MANIAVILASGYEDTEYSKPAQAFKVAGHTLTHIGLCSEETIHGMHHMSTIRLEKTFSEVQPEQFDALLIPGGYSPDKLRVDQSAVSFVEKFFKSDKLVFAICHGPQILITANVLKGRILTGWKSIEQDIINAGAKFVDLEVVKDGKLVTGRNPHDIPAFIDTCLRMLNEIGTVR